MKICNRCKIDKPLDAYYKKKGSADGLFWWCRDCHKKYVAAKYHALAKDENYRVAERKRIRIYHQDNPEKVRAWYQQYAANNRHKLNAKSKAYALSRERRTPSWLTKEDLWMLEEAYELAALRTKMLGFAWQVDHVIPLHGTLASGLHVPQNVQVIPAKLNRRKSNQYEVT
jgi:hypothetical protein